MKKAVYLSQQEFDTLSKCKDVVSYKNKYLKRIGDIYYHIITDGVGIEVKLLSDKEKNCYCAVKTDEDVVMLSLNDKGFRTLGWFPTELVAGLKGGYVNMNTPLSRKTGWLEDTDASGSFTACFLKSKVEEAIKILENNGFKIIRNGEF